MPVVVIVLFTFLLFSQKTGTLFGLLVSKPKRGSKQTKKKKTDTKENKVLEKKRNKQDKVWSFAKNVSLSLSRVKEVGAKFVRTCRLALALLL